MKSNRRPPKQQQTNKKYKHFGAKNPDTCEVSVKGQHFESKGEMSRGKNTEPKKNDQFLSSSDKMRKRPKKEPGLSWRTEGRGGKKKGDISLSKDRRQYKN